MSNRKFMLAVALMQVSIFAIGLATREPPQQTEPGLSVSDGNQEGYSDTEAYHEC